MDSPPRSKASAASRGTSISALRRCVEGDAVVALILIASETTEQVRAERAIATQARMIESMLEGVAVINDEGVIEITNPAFDALFGYRRGELIGREMATLAGWPFERPERWRLTSGDQTLRVEFDGWRADGSHFAAQGVLSRFEVAGQQSSPGGPAGRERAQAARARDSRSGESRAIPDRQRSPRRPRSGIDRHRSDVAGRRRPARRRNIRLSCPRSRASRAS